MPLSALELALTAPSQAELAAADEALTGRQADAKKAFEEGLPPFVKNCCTKCHANRRTKGGVNFEAALKSPGDTKSIAQSASPPSSSPR